MILLAAFVPVGNAPGQFDENKVTSKSVSHNLLRTVLSGFI